MLWQIKEKDLKDEEVIGVGIGVPGPVTQDGTVLKCANLGWVQFQLQKHIALNVHDHHSHIDPFLLDLL